MYIFFYLLLYHGPLNISSEISYICYLRNTGRMRIPPWSIEDWISQDESAQWATSG